LLGFFLLEPFADLLSHCPANFLRRIFAGVGNNDCNLAWPDLFGRFEDHLEKQRIDVIGTR